MKTKELQIRRYESPAAETIVVQAEGVFATSEPFEKDADGLGGSTNDLGYWDWE